MRTASAAMVACAMVMAASVANAQTVEESPYLTGDWDGERTRLADAGIVVGLGYVSESAHNFSGGTARLTRYADEWSPSLVLDLQKLAGWEETTLKIVYTVRDGNSLDADAHLGTYMPVQEVYGRGQTILLSELRIIKHFFDGRLDWSLGRVSLGDGFAAETCYFQNLTFCGGQPGNLVGSYWINWPLSVWGTGGRVHLNSEMFFTFAAFQVNPAYTEQSYQRHDGWKPDFPSGTEGALFPLEFDWTPNWKGLPGDYLVGAWYSNARNGADVFTDINGNPIVLTGLPPKQHDRRYGGYFDIRQQITGKANGKGLTLDLRFAQADRFTALTDRQITVSAIYFGVFGRQRDAAGIAVGVTYTNSRIAEAARLADAANVDADLPVLGQERAIEVFYDFSPNRWLHLRPNLQYVRDPGGNPRNDDVFVVGLKSIVAF